MKSVKYKVDQQNRTFLPVYYLTHAFPYFETLKWAFPQMTEIDNC